MLFLMIQWVTYGPDALLLRFSHRTGDDAFRLGRAIIAELEKHPPHGLIECVPGFTTVLLQFDPAHEVNLALLGQHVAAQLANVEPTAVEERPIKSVRVRYNGPDIEALAEEKRLSVGDVIEIHAQPVYQVCLLGFSPGFPYLGGLDERLHAPRHPSPRPRITAGSVAIGGEHTGIYSVDSPGGWRIIGHTRTAMFRRRKLSRTVAPEELFFLEPGDRLRFVPTKR